MVLDYSVHHIVPRIHQEASGTTYTVPRLCTSLDQLGVDTHLHVIRAASQNYKFNLHVHAYWSNLERLGVSPKMQKALNTIASSKDTVIHNHSLWMMPNVYAGQVKIKNKETKLVVSPHGTLSEYALNQSKWKKKVLWYLLGQRLTLKHADLFHATSINELEDIRRLGYKQPIALIPNGIDFTERQSIKKTYPFIVLFLGRLHPIKGLDNLIQAWSNIETEKNKDWQLIIAGPEGKSGYKNKLINTIHKNELTNVKLIGPVYKEEKYRLLAEASVFIMPSHSENFNITVAEALYQETPVIASDKTPWEDLIKNQCGWWVDNNPTSLSKVLKKMMNMPKEKLSNMGEMGNQWVRNNFGWDFVGQRLQKTYQWLLGNTEKPEWIIYD